MLASGRLDDLLGDADVRIRVTDLPARGRGPWPIRVGQIGRRRAGSRWRPVEPTTRIPDVVAALVAAGGRVHAVDAGRATLEDLFLELIRDGSDGRR